MLIASIPTKFVIPWAKNAGGGFITEPIPQTTASPGRASLDQGFPTTTFEPEASGGNPPWGADMNGILNQVTQWLQWSQSGGGVGYDATFQTAISGYPNRALIQSSTAGHYWISTVDNNATDPDTGGAGWQMFPDVIVQAQAGNFTATDSGSVNAAAITLSPAPASWAAIEGAPLRWISAYTNTTTAVTVNVNGLGTKTLKNPDGTAMDIGQITAGGLVEGFYDSVNVQVAAPGHAAGAAARGMPPGGIILWPIETVPVGFLACNGASYLASAYPNLYLAIGTKYGAADGSHFNVPDMRGLFVRGWDNGRGLDANAGTRAAPGVLAPAVTGATGLGGDFVGTTEAWAIGPITGSITINWPVIYMGANNTAGAFLYNAAAAALGSTPYASNPFNPSTPFEGYGGQPPNSTLGGGYVFGTQLNGAAGSWSAYYNYANAYFATGYSFGPGGTTTDTITNSIAVQSLGGAASSTIVTSTTETRPVNINMQYIIAY